MPLNEDRLFQLAQGWSTRDHGLDMVSLVRDDVEIPNELEEVSFQFYRQAKPGEEASSSKDKDPGSTTATPFQTPAKPKSKDKAKETPSTSTANQGGAEVSEGLVTVFLGNVREQDKSATDIYADAVEHYRVPEGDRLTLLHKIRVAQAMRDPDSRRRMLVLRLLATAVLGPHPACSSPFLGLFTELSRRSAHGRREDSPGSPFPLRARTHPSASRSRPPRSQRSHGNPSCFFLRTRWHRPLETQIL
jgi:hypothetical protein